MSRNCASGRVRCALFIVAAIALSACGNAQQAKTAPPGDDGWGDNAETQAAAPDSAAYVDAAFGALHCPAQANGALQGPDVLGVRLGATREQAMGVLHCQRRDFSVRRDPSFLGARFTRDDLGPQAFTILNGRHRASDPTDLSHQVSGNRCRMGELDWTDASETIHVETPGSPGQERALGIWRWQRFADDRRPPAADVVADIARKYGAPMSREDGQYATELRWAWDAAGAPIAPANPLFRQCAQNLDSAVGGAQQWSEACGQTIAATVRFANDNTALATDLYVGLTNQAAFYRAGEALERWVQTQTQTRQQQELERARTHASDVSL